MAGENHICPNCGNVTTVLPTSVPVAMAPPADVHYDRGPKQSKDLAVAALVLGICGFVPCLGAVTAVVGIILGIRVLAGRRPGKRLAIGGIVTGTVSLLLVQVAIMVGFPPSFFGRVNGGGQSPCRSSLKCISTSVALYMTDYDGVVPANLQALVDEKFLDRHRMQCPSEGTDGKVDYFYFCLPADAPGYAFMACDFKGNHGGKGRSVARFDTSVRYLTEAEFRKLLARPQNAAFAKALAEVEGP